MADKESYNDYLAARVLVEGKPVTYRLLSRALSVHVALAKRMLFDFHQKQNARKPGSVHATYLVTGTKRNAHHTNGVDTRNGEDNAMRASPFMSSMPETAEAIEPTVKRTGLILVREEELQKHRAHFEIESSIHVYSLESGPIENLGILTTCNHEIATQYASRDPMEQWRTHGSIHNTNIKRRTAKLAPPSSSSTSKSVIQPVPNADVKLSIASGLKREASTATQGGSDREENASGRSTPQPSAGSATLKRSDSKSGSKKIQPLGDLFKSFAKTKSKSEDAAASQNSSLAPTEDVPMQGMSEDEDDGQDEPGVKIDEEKNEAVRKARIERQEKLRKMMEDDDMPDAPSPSDPQPDTKPSTQADTTEVPEEQPTVTVDNGRRRGRRRVTKKKKVKDEDGYLVTKEETVWESFSEEEPEAKKMKLAPTRTTSSTKSKPAGKKGQGSIASFFKKA